MFRNENDLLEAGCTADELRAIKSQYRGGVSGAKGSQYEDVYATWRLINAMERYLATGLGASVQRQALCAVDDVVYEDTGTEEYCQLKTSPATAWTAEGGKLEAQFALQQRLCQNAPTLKPFVLRLVTPDERRRTLLEDGLPVSLSETTRVDYFQGFENLSELWTVGGACYELLTDLCAFEGDSPSRRENIFFVFFDVIQKAPAATPCSLNQVIEEVMQQRPTCALRLRDFALPEKWPQAVSILRGIANLNVDIIGGICHYVYEEGFLEEGDIGRTGTERLERFLDRVIEREPETFDEFQSLL